MKNPDCYKCIYRQAIPGNAHSTCKHPESGSDNQIGLMFAILAGVGRAKPQLNTRGILKLQIDGDMYSVKMGWFNWPYCFDPVWLRNCDGFQGKQST